MRIVTEVGAGVRRQPHWAGMLWLSFCGIAGMVGPDVAAWATELLR
jgi:hypothetical protein